MFHLRRMPPNLGRAPGGLGDNVYASILAYLLQANGQQPAAEALPSDPNALAAMTIPRREGTTADPPPAPVVASASGAARLAGLSAVTDGMLRNPTDRDWLQWGRTYDGQNFSPLEVITRDNVQNLKPAWRAPLRAGLSMPTPLVHDGVMFLQTIPDTVLALDASNGEVLWRYQYHAVRAVEPEDGPRAARRQGVRADVRPPRDGAEREDWRAGLGPRDRNGQSANVGAKPLSAARRAAGRRQQGHPGRDGELCLQAAASSSASTSRRGRRCGDSTPSPGPASPAATAGTACRWIDGAADRSGTRAPTTPSLNLVYFGVAPTYDTVPLAAAVGRRRRDLGCAVHELHDRAEPRHGEAGLALPARRQRSVGSRLGVRAAARRDDDRRHDGARW